MENNKKSLKISSILILVLAAASALRLIANLIGGINIDPAQLPAGISTDLANSIIYVFVVMSFVMLLPQIYVGLKGLKVSHSPDSSRGYIIIATILIAFTALAAVSPVTELIGGGDIRANVLELLDYLVDISIYASIIKYGNLIRRAV